MGAGLCCTGQGGTERGAKSGVRERRARQDAAAIGLDETSGEAAEVAEEVVRLRQGGVVETAGTL